MDNCNSTKRSRFSYSDDQAMLKFLVSELKAGNDDARNPFGNRIWQKAINRRILTNKEHSVASIRDHFRRQLWPYLEVQSVSAGDRAYLRKHIASKDVETRSKADEDSEVSGDESEGRECVSDSDVYAFTPKKKFKKKGSNESTNGNMATTAAFAKQSNLQSNQASTNKVVKRFFQTSPGEKLAALKKKKNLDGSGSSIDVNSGNTSKELIIDVNAPITKSILLGMVEEKKLSLTDLPKFTGKLKRLSEIAKKYGTNIRVVAELASELKSWALVEEKMERMAKDGKK